MTRDDINEIRDTAAAVIPLRDVANEAEKTLWQAEKELSDVIAKRKTSPLDNCTQESVTADIATAAALEEKIKSSKEKSPSRLVPIFITILGLIGLLITSGFLHPFSRWIPTVDKIFSLSVPGVIVAALVMFAGIALFFVKPKKKATDSETLSQLLEKYNVSSSAKLANLLASYTAILRDEEGAKAARDSAKLAFESASSAALSAEEKAVAKLAPFMPEIKSGEQVISALNDTENLIEQLTKAQFDMVSAQNIYDTLSADCDETQEVDESYLPMPIRNREDTLAALTRTRGQLKDATRAFDLATGAQRSLGDPAVIEGRIKSIKEEIEIQTKQFQALSIAVETLSDANSELQTRFSPLISKKAGQILSSLTDGRYEKLVFDKGFDAQVKEATSPVDRNVLALSDGTADEVYFSLRLAMCQLILGGDDPCPIILDDALTNFDEQRCKRALDLLCDMAATRQIILFTCHSREAQYLSGREGVNIQYI